MNKRLVLYSSLLILLAFLCIYLFVLIRMKARSPIYIRVDGTIDPSKASISTVDKRTYFLNDTINCTIVIERSNIVVDGGGFTLQGTGGINSRFGLHLIKVSNVTVKNMIIRKFEFGVFLHSSSYNNLSSNSITTCRYDNIHLESSSNNIISGNSLRKSVRGIHLNSSSNSNTISGNNLRNNINGVQFDSSVNNTISENNITESTGEGIYLRQSSGNMILSNNIIASRGDGLRLYKSSKNTMSRNTIKTNGANGIFLRYSSSNNAISENTITANNGTGIDLSGSSNNTIFKNDIATNSWYGFQISSSNFNVISRNNVTANKVRGIHLYSSSNNIIFHNNLVDNTESIVIWQSGINVWDNSLEGNYWSNYTGTDLNHDGIGDSPHNIASGNIDNFPLMGEIHNFNATSDYEVQTIGSSTITNFQFHGATISFNVTGKNDTIGFCRICIPKDLISPPYNITINNGTVEALYFNNTIYDNDTHRWIYFAYEHSTLEVTIVRVHSTSYSTTIHAGNTTGGAGLQKKTLH